ncbi:MAG: head GIN domain-containing protein [Candidatus Cyclobacteriaceae bacterium M2_1C_046]
MQRLFVPLVFLLFLINCNGISYERGNGDIVEKKKNIGEFDEVHITGNYDITFKPTEKPSLTITTDENLHQYIDVEQDGNVLKIVSTKGLRSDHGVKMTIGYQDINQLKLGGASTVTNESVLTGDRFTLEMAGAGALKMEMDVQQLKVNISGAGSVELKGKTESQEVHMSGAGGLDAEELISENAEIHISGVGGAHVYVTNSLKASVSGVGGITYSGNPKEVRKDISGLGSISEK